MTSKEAVANQLFQMQKVRVEFHLNDGSVHQAWVVGWEQKTGDDRVNVRVGEFSIKKERK